MQAQPGSGGRSEQRWLTWTSAGLEQSEYRERQRPWRQHRSSRHPVKTADTRTCQASILHGQRDVRCGRLSGRSHRPASSQSGELVARSGCLLRDRVA